MMVKNKLRKANDDISQLSDNIFEGADANLYMTIQRDRGLLNLAFFAKFKSEYSKALAGLLGTMTGENTAKDVDELVEAFKETSIVIASL